MNEEIKKEAEEIEDKGAEEGQVEPEEDTSLPRVFIVGLGQTGRELLYKLAGSTRVTGIDTEERKLKIDEKRLRGASVKVFKRDGTSRLTWEELGLSEDDTMVSVTRRDDVNLEVCRIARENFGVKRMLGLIHSAGRAEEYAAAGIETVSRAKVLASFMMSRVLKDHRTAMNIGLGQGEIIEVPILPGSSVVGRPLRSFRARPWLVGAVYRKDALIVPHGNTAIEEGDRILLIGEPHILSSVAEFFKMGEPEFPLQYGYRVGVLGTKEKDEHYQSLVSESHYVAEHSKATSWVLLSLPGHSEPDVGMAEKICGGTNLSCVPAYFPDEEHKPWPQMLQAQDFGCLVMAAPKLGFFRRLGVGRSLLRRILQEAEYPVLISRGTHPYDKILIPASIKSNPLRVSQLAIDIARLFNSRLDAITVTEPVFSAGKEAVEEQKMVLDRIMEQSHLYRLSLKIYYREGNPIKEVVDFSSAYNLLVIGYRRRKRSIFPRLDTAMEILARVKCSVLILPMSESEEEGKS